jgi:hypothetical protein
MKAPAVKDVNRRWFVTPINGFRFRTDFDIHWCAIDKNGWCFLYESRPYKDVRAWLPGRVFGMMEYAYFYVGSFDWTKSIWRLTDAGKWERG